MKEITLTKEQYERLPYKDTDQTKDDSFGDIIRLLRKHGIRKHFIDDEEESFSFILTVKYRDMEKQYPVKIVVPHLMCEKKVNPHSKYSATKLTYLEKESWRVAWWYIKAKIDAITYGISDDFREFMPNIYHTLEDKTDVFLGDALLKAKSLNEFAQLEDKSEEKPKDTHVINVEYEVKTE